jgi:hypothetical protein
MIKPNPFLSLKNFTLPVDIKKIIKIIGTKLQLNSEKQMIFKKNLANPSEDTIFLINLHKKPPV